MMAVHFAVLYIQACVLFGYTARHAHPAKKQINRLFFALQELGDMNLCCFLEFYFLFFPLRLVLQTVEHRNDICNLAFVLGR